MKCFYHPQSDAVGICKSCSKGLCRECAVDVGDGIACKDKCENRVKMTNELVAWNMATVKEGRIAEPYFRNAIIYVLFGLPFSVFGLIVKGSPVSYFLFPCGIIMFIAAGFSYSTGKKLQRK